MPHIVFLVQVAFTPRDHARYGIALIAARGIAVTVLDVGPIAVPELGERPAQPPEFPGMSLRVVRDRHELEGELPTLKAASVVICQVGSGFFDRRNLPVLRLLARSGAPSLVLNTNPMPFWSEPARVRGGLACLLPMLRRRLTPLTSLMNRLPLGWLGLRPFDFVVCGGRKSRIRRPLLTSATRVISAHSMDYDALRKDIAQGEEPNGKPFAVFIDQAFAYHPDTVAAGDDGHKPGPLYDRFRSLFERIEKELGLEVVIAGHPRIDYSLLGDLFGGRRMVIERTPALIAGCRLAVTVSSTAIGIAIQCRKPVLMVATGELLAHPVGLSVKRMAERVCKSIHLIEERPPLDDAFAVDVASYDRYIADFVKEPGTPDAPLWQIVLDELREAGVLPRTGAPTAAEST